MRLRCKTTNGASKNSCSLLPSMSILQAKKKKKKKKIEM